MELVMANTIETLNLDDVICLTDEDLNSPTDQIKGVVA
jgi:hypothetical protein